MSATAESVDRTPLNERHASYYRAAAARANYLALDRAEMMFSAKELCRQMSAPRVRDLDALRRVDRYLLGQPRVVQNYVWQEDPGFLDVFTDTDFAGCVATRKSTSGGCGLLGKHCVKYWSQTQKAITLSSGEAELVGVVKGTGEALGIQSLMKDLGWSVRARVHADSSAAIGICSRSGVGQVRHLAVAQLCVQQKVKEKAITLHKVLGTANPADLLTKHLARQALDACMRMLGSEFATGRTSAAPRLAAEVEAFLRRGSSTRSTTA